MIKVYEILKVVLSPILQVTFEEYDQMLKTTREEWLERNSYARLVRVNARNE